MSDISADDDVELLPRGQTLGGQTLGGQTLGGQAIGETPRALQAHAFADALLPPLPAGPPTLSPLLVFDTIRRRKFSIILTTLVALLAGCSWVTRLPQHYLSTATLMLVDRRSELTTLPNQGGAFNSEPVAARTQVDLLRSASLERQVVEALDLVHAPEFARVIHPAPTLLHVIIDRALNLAIIDRARNLARLYVRWWPHSHPVERDDIESATSLLHSKISIVNDGRSYVIDIQVRTEDPALAPQIANALAQNYLALKTRIKSDALQRANERFEAKLVGLQNRVRHAQQAVADYREQTGLIDNRAAASLTGVTPASQLLAQLGNQLAAATAERARIEATIVQIRSTQSRAAGRSTDFSAIPEVVASTLIERLHEQEAILGGREADLAVSRGPSDPSLMAVRAAKLDVQHKISNEIGRIIASLSNAADAARAREASVRSNLATLEAQVAGEGRTAVRLMALQSEADAANSVYNSVLDRVRQTANEVDMQEPDAVLVSTAAPAISPAMPNHTQLVLLVFVAAPLFALLIALLRDRVRPGLRSSESVEALTGLPCLGFIPTRRGRRGERAFVDAVGGLPAMLGQLRPRVLLLTSAVPGEGTSVLAEALARSVAETGDQVLLVHCAPGLAPPYLPQPNLEVISAIPPALPQAARHNYDLIILDTPAVLASSKTLPLVGVAEATILVVRFGHTPPSVVLRATRLLRRHQARMAGTVVTRVEQRELSAADGIDLYLEQSSRLSMSRAAARWR
jgi:uncharacterized protein involved in exopolysaccharide biosynthesis